MTVHETAPYDLALQPICGASTDLPAALVTAAMAFAPPGAEGFDVERDLRCTLQTHTTGDHFGLITEVPGLDIPCSVWTRWNLDRDPRNLVVLPDCPAANGPDVCTEFADHAGAHSYELDYSSHELADAMSGGPALR